MKFEVNYQSPIAIKPPQLKKVVAAFAAAYRAASGRNMECIQRVKASQLICKKKKCCAPAASFSLAFIGEAAMKKINRAYRGQNRPTDVLSFASDAAEKRWGEWGEILICPAVARRQAGQSGATLNREIARLLIHGLAHLAGFDHEGVSRAKAAQMAAFEATVETRMKFRAKTG